MRGAASMLVGIVSCLLTAGCAHRPTVVIENRTGDPLVGYVQIPSIVKVGYAPTNSRRSFAIRPGASERFKYDRHAQVSAYGSDAFLLLRAVNVWHVLDFPAEGKRRLDIRISRIDDDGVTAATADAMEPARITTFATREEMLEQMGERRR